MAEISNPAVTREILEEILYWKEEGCTQKDIITRLRNRTVPSGYKYHNWRAGEMI